MIGVFVDQGITYKETPPLETVNIETEEMKGEKNNDISGSYFLTASDISIVDDPNETIEKTLTKSQKYFLEKSKNSLNEIIRKELFLLESEGIQPPNNRSLSNTLQIIDLLAYSSLFPNRIATSFEEGICLIFNKENQSLYIEIYNDGDMGYIIEDTKKKIVLENEDIFSYNDAVNVVNYFYSL